MKKLISRSVVCLILFMLLLTSFGSFGITSFASELNATKSTRELSNYEFEEMINSLEKYVSFEDNEIKFDNLPKQIIQRYGADTIREIKEGVVELNKLADSGELVITDNGTIYETDNDDFVIQGGANQVVVCWWGHKLYMSTNRTNSYVTDCYRVATGATTVAVIAGYFSFGTATLFGGLTSAYFSLLGSNVSSRNAGHSRGVIVNMTWSSAYTTEKQ